MKLQNKINIRFLLVTLVVFVIAGVLFYWALGHVVDYNIREMLDSRKASVLLYLQNSDKDKLAAVSQDRTIFIRKISKTTDYTLVSDTLAFDPDEKGMIPCRKMVFSAVARGDSYEVTILQSLLESEDLQAVIFSFMTLLFLIIFVALFFLNNWLSNKAWKPFIQSSSKLKSWKLSELHLVRFEKTGVTEFDQLNQMLEEMMEKMQADWVNLREFTDNASHELQTPLAIMKSKLELLLNEDSITGMPHNQLYEMFQTVIRLAKMNEALLLLSKIENRQFGERAEIDLSGLIQSRLSYLGELFAMKEIELVVGLEASFIVQIHPMLADILVNNLLSNALNHNFSLGRITLQSENQEIVISNTGIKQPLDPQKIFRRFVKGSSSMNSNGLGLAIAAEICQANHLDLAYAYLNDCHCFTLRRTSDSQKEV
jgi:signal transduction histidine kinase